jgi:hypothetical protein
MNPQDMDVTFLVFTSNNKYTPDIFNYTPSDQTITNSHFNGGRETKMITHGWIDRYEETGWLGVNINNSLFDWFSTKINLISFLIC